MTVTSLTRDTIYSGPYTGNGSTKTFPFAFKAWGKDDIQVETLAVGATARAVVNPSLYSGVFGSGEGGSITFSTAPASGVKVYIFPNPSFLQSINYTDGGPFRAATMNEEADRSAVRDILLRNYANRTLRLPQDETVAELPLPAQRANTIPGFNIAGLWTMLTATDIAQLIISQITALLGGASKGDPGGNVTATGSFKALANQTIPAGIEAVWTTCYVDTLKGKGGGRYIKWEATKPALPGTGQDIWWQQSLDGAKWYPDPADLDFYQFGAKGDTNTSGVGTDDYPAWLAAKECLHYFRNASSTNTDYKMVPPLWFDSVRYYFSATVDLTDAAYQLFCRSNNINGFGGCRIYFAAGIGCGFIFQSFNTSGISGTTPLGGARGAQNSHLKDITAYSKGGTVGADQHGFLIKTQVTCERCAAMNWGGHGFAIISSTPNANANGWKLVNCIGYQNGLDGLHTEGADANAGASIGFYATRNARYGIAEMSFLGNYHRDYLLEGNGAAQLGGPSWQVGYSSTAIPSSMTDYGGKRWRVVPGQEVLASTTQPGTNEAVWTQIDFAPSFLAPAWVSGMTFRSGGAFFVGNNVQGINQNNQSVMWGYIEPDQASAWSFGAAVLFNTDAKYGASLSAYNYGLRAGQIGSRYIYYDAGGVKRFVSNILGNWNAQAPVGTAQTLIAQRANTSDGTEGAWYEYLDDHNDHRLSSAGISDIWIWHSAFSTFQPNGRSAAHISVPQFPQGAYLGGAFHTSGTAAPASGIWGRGDRVNKTDTTLGGPLQYVSVAAGGPPTFYPTGIVGGVQAASVALAAGATPTKAEFDALINSLKTARLMA